MICPHEFFTPDSLKCARCGEPGRYPSSAMSRHTRVGAPDTQSERWIADRERPAGVRAKHAHEPLFTVMDTDLWAIATAEMRAGVQA